MFKLTFMRNALQRTWLILFSATLLLVYSCKKDDDPTPEVIAGFSFEVSMDNYKKVTFTNTSQNYDAVSWNFGDNTAVSADVNHVLVDVLALGNEIAAHRQFGPMAIGSRSI